MKRKTRARKAGGAKSPRLPKDAVMLTVILHAREGRGPLLEAELRALVAPTLREEGCLRYDLHRGADQPESFLLHEVWASRDHHTKHTRTAHFLHWNARKDTLVQSRESAFWKQIQ